jgi:ADP-ribosylglycohydrolase
MFGAIVGDIAGSTFEARNCRFEGCEIFATGSRFTDDSVLTLATAHHFLTGESYSDLYQIYGRRYPLAGYGASFRTWMLSSNPKPYNSWGNGSAMRVSPVGWVAESLDWALEESKRSAEVTHDHPEGIKGAQSVSAAIFLARTGATKDTIREFISRKFGYDLNRTIDEIRPTYIFEVSCQHSVPEAIIAFLESDGFESAIRKAISLGGDSDTIACIAGSIAHAFYGSIPDWMIGYCRQKLDSLQIDLIDDFWARFPKKSSGQGVGLNGLQP